MEREWSVDVTRPAMASSQAPVASFYVVTSLALHGAHATDVVGARKAYPQAVPIRIQDPDVHGGCLVGWIHWEAIMTTQTMLALVGGFPTESYSKRMDGDNRKP